MSIGWRLLAATASLLGAQWAAALGPGEVLVVGNTRSPVSKSIVEYYARARGIASSRVLYLRTSTDEEIDRAVFEREIAGPVAGWLTAHGEVERTLALVTTTGVPLKIRGTQGQGGTAAAVDSELACLYMRLKGQRVAAEGVIENPYYRQNEPFAHPKFPMYLVARLTGYTFADVRASIDRGLRARNRGVVVLDQRNTGVEDDGDLWLLQASNRLPAGRARLEESQAVARGMKDVIGYAGWGSNDRSRRDRDLGMQFVDGAVVSEYVSTNGRTFMEPPAGWQLGEWKRPETHFAGSPQSMAGDAIRQGATAVTAHVYEPYLTMCPRPEWLFPAYLSGRTLGESYYASIPALSWMNVLVGDPLVRVAR